MAMRLDKVFGGSAESWLVQQAQPGGQGGDYRRELSVEFVPASNEIAAKVLTLTPPHRNQRLSPPSQPLPHNPGARKQAPQIAGVQQPDIAQIVLDVILPAVRAGPLDQRPHRESSRHATLPARGKEMQKRRQQVRLDGKPAVWRLYPVTAADAGDLCSELALALPVSLVLDHGVAKDHVERAIAKRQMPSIARNPTEAALGFLPRARHVENRHARAHRDQRPVERRSADIQNLRPIGDAEGPHKPLHAPGAEMADYRIEQRRSSLACVMQHDAAAVGLRAVLEQVDALPRSERQTAIDQRNAQLGGCQRRSI